jgi:phosphate-selective porin OprO/OprP
MKEEERMQKFGKFFGYLVTASLFMSPAPILAEEAKKKSVNERIIEILIQNGVITQEQYDELKTLAQEEEARESSEKPKVVAGYNKGFYIETTDKKHKLKFDGRFQGDFKAYLGEHPDDASFFIRRARLCSSGTLYNYYDFRVEAEFARGSTRLNDGFMNIHYWPEAQLMFGQFKVPYSMEELHSDNWIDFVERSLANKIAPSRDVGAMIHGGLADELLYYQAGIFNGYKLNQVVDVDGGKDGSLRLVLAPFKKSSRWFVEGLRLGGSITYGNEELKNDDWWNSGDWSTAAGTKYLVMADGVFQDGTRTRIGAELYWDWGSLALKAEYMNVDFEGLQVGTLINDYDVEGAYISLDYWLTGEKHAYKKGAPARVVPIENFELGGSGWGAFQIGARYEFVEADEGLLDQGYVDATQYTDRADGFTIGLNWYPNEMIRLMLNYYHVKFEDDILVSGQRIDDEDVILTRLQAVF